MIRIMEHSQRNQMFQTSFIRLNTIVVSKAKPILTLSLVGTLTKFMGITTIITLRGGRVPESFHRSQFSVVAAWVPPAQQMAKRSRPFTDEPSKHTGALRQSKPEGKRVLALPSVRHQKSSPVISAQEKTQSGVKDEENPNRALGDRLRFSGVHATGDQSRMGEQSDDPSPENSG